jgi:hypothetical protein
MNALKQNKTDYKTHFTSGAKSYMFWHLGAIIKEFISHKSFVFVPVGPTNLCF